MLQNSVAMEKYRSAIILLFCYLKFTHILAIDGNCLPVTVPGCSCFDDTLKCKGIYNMEDLSTATKAARDYGPSELRLKDSQLPALPDDLFQQSNFTRFKIEKTVLPFLAKPYGQLNPFSGATLLSDLTVDNVGYPYNWNWTLLSVLSHLSTLRILHSNLLYIGPSFRSISSTSLHVLIIDSCRVRWIHEGAFASFSNISYFQLMNNDFTSIRRSYLPTPAAYLSLINLKNNKLTFVDEDFFSDMPQLTYVNLQNNNFVTISSNILSEKQYQRIFIDIAGNPFECDCSISWLSKKTVNFDTYRIQCFNSSTQDSLSIMSINWKKIC